MSFALTQLRTPLNAKAFGLVVAALALGSSTTVATVAIASHQTLPTVTTQAPATTDTQSSTTPTDSTTGNDSTTSNNANANAFGQRVVQQVNTCKAQAATAGTHGIGQCVSDWVTKYNPGASHHTH